MQVGEGQGEGGAEEEERDGPDEREEAQVFPREGSPAPTHRACGDDPGAEGGETASSQGEKVQKQVK